MAAVVLAPPVACAACNKVYADVYSLRRHWRRQPLCERWMELQPGLKDYIDDKFNLPMTDAEAEAARTTTCLACRTTFSNAGNLNRHLDTSVVCSKWAMFRELQPLAAYVSSSSNAAPSAAPAHELELEQPKGADDQPLACSYMYAPHVPSKHQLCHIIWNVFLVDKAFMASPDAAEAMAENNVRYVIAILPDEATYREHVRAEVEHAVMVYEGHTPRLDVEAFEEQCRRIEAHRAQRHNVFVFCNSGYQRSIPFLCYYLTRHHADEVPSVERAIDIILPQVDKANYAALRAGYIDSVTALLDKKT